jgi:probable HAF family extracellular repeat protein
MRISIVTLALIVAALSSPLSGQLASTINLYQFTVVDVPDAEITVVNRVNDRGELLGDFRLRTERTPFFPIHGFLLSAGVVTQLDVPGAEGTSASDFDSDRVIVGWAHPEAGGYVFDRAASTFATLPPPIKQALGTNELGDIVGVAEPIEGVHTSAFVRSDGVVARFNFPAAQVTAAADVNDARVIVGWYAATPQSDQRSGFMRQPDGPLLPLTVPGSISTAPLGINNAGQIVGWYTDGNRTSGFLYDNGMFHRIDVPGSTSTSLLGINNHGDIAGAFRDATGAHGFVASPLADVIAGEIAGLPDSAFGTEATGLRSAFTNRLQHIHRLIMDGDVAAALRELENLRRRVDGCPDPPTTPESAERDDWIEPCDSQRAVRALIDDFITALSAHLDAASGISCETIAC